MELTSQIKMVRFQTFWSQMQKNKHLDESRKTGQTSGTKMAFYSKEIDYKLNSINFVIILETLNIH
ncbi:hypothetical protein Hanom_Chr07g00607191 [Helianthus anomalus]